ncbi:MAG: LytR/AlgR family response regulator transcription factor [archaeon]
MLKTKVNVRSGGKIHLIDKNQIIMVESKQYKLIIILENGNSYVIPGSLKNFSEKLGKFFFRCHRSYLINLNKIKTFDIRNNTIKLKCEKKAPLSRRNKKKFLNIIE